MFCIILSSPVVSANFRKFSILSGLKAENASWSEMRAADNNVECCLLCDSHPVYIAANTGKWHEVSAGFFAKNILAGLKAENASWIGIWAANNDV